MLDSNALSYIVFVVLETLTVINCIITLKLNIRLRINNCLNKNNINHHDTNTKKLSINNNSLTININLISIIKKMLILIQVNITYIISSNKNRFF